MNSTTYAKRDQYKPIDIFFRGVVDSKTKNKKVYFVDTYQVLNDRYLGRMAVCNYFVIAENSVRINELNIIALEELKNYDLVMRENFLIPDNVIYSVPISVRFLENDKDFGVLLDTLKDNKYKKGSLIMSFLGNTLIRLDAEGRKRYAYLRKLGYKTAIAGFGEDYNSLDIFGELSFDVLRCEARYFDATPRKKAVLQMLVKHCAASKIDLVMEGVDSPAQYSRFKREGVRYMTGRGVSKLSRWVTNEFLGVTAPRGEKKEAYLAKLNKELDAKRKAEQAELEALRQEAIERAREQDGEGVMPISPRPELAKSPYQVRLEQQRNTARKIVLDIVEEQEEEEQIAQAELIEQNEPQENEEFAREMMRMRYEGEVQSALALTYAYDNKDGVTDKGDKKPLVFRHDEEGKPTVTEAESGVTAPVRPLDEEGNPAPTKVKKQRRAVRADLDAEARLLGEYRSDSLFGGLSESSGMKGFGVTLHVASQSEDEPEVVGTYNDRGQFVDEEGNVYNGYFDADGNWVEYEQYDVAQEGHYNENAQWVDADGNVYDGYFDEEGRWIDYSYSDPNGEIVDNGYFDQRIGKWVPFGYFDADGAYHKF